MHYLRPIYQVNAKTATCRHICIPAMQHGIAAFIPACSARESPSALVLSCHKAANRTRYNGKDGYACRQHADPQAHSSDVSGGPYASTQNGVCAGTEGQEDFFKSTLGTCTGIFPMRQASLPVFTVNWIPLPGPPQPPHQRTLFCYPARYPSL